MIGARVGVALVPLHPFFVHWNGLLDIQNVTTPGDSRRTLALRGRLSCSCRWQAFTVRLTPVIPPSSAPHPHKTHHQVGVRIFSKKFFKIVWSLAGPSDGSSMAQTHPQTVAFYPPAPLANFAFYPGDVRLLQILTPVIGTETTAFSLRFSVNALRKVRVSCCCVPDFAWCVPDFACFEFPVPSRWY